MSNVKISALPAGVATSSTPFAAVVSGVTDQVTLAPIYTTLATLTAASFNSSGYCRLQVDSTTALSLQRYQGSTLPIKTGSTWAAMTIPSSGPSLSTSGLSASTLYRIYAFNSSGTLTLEASATAHAVDSTTGVEIKSGDATRTLVGMVLTDSSTHFLDSTSNRWLINWFNRRSLDLMGTFSADRSTGSDTFAELNTEVRMNFLSWADEAITASGSGTLLQSSNGQASGTALGIDGLTVVAGTATTFTGFSNTWQDFAVSLSKSVSEGSHYVTLLGACSGGSGTWASADSITTGPMKTRIWATIRG